VAGFLAPLAARRGATSRSVRDRVCLARPSSGGCRPQSEGADVASRRAAREWPRRSRANWRADEGRSAGRQLDLLVNTTPVGMCRGVDDRVAASGVRLVAGRVVYDLCL